MFLLKSRRPLYVIAITVAFTTACVVANGEEHGFKVAIVAALCLLLVLCIPPLRRIGVLYLIAFGVILSSLGTYLRYTQTVLPLASLEGKTVMVTARVDTVIDDEDQKCLLTVTEQGALPKGTRISAIVENEKWQLEKYAFFNGRVSLYQTENASLHGDGVFLAGEVELVLSTAPPTPEMFEVWSDTLRYGFVEGLYETLPYEQAVFSAGVCVGDVSALSTDLVTDFRKSGLAHLTVVSGLHMTILSGAVQSLFRHLRMRRGVATVITLSSIWLFMLMVGFSVSVIRAAVMLHCLLLGGVFRRRADSRTSLSVALLLILLQNPYAVCDVGFLLSFASTWGLIVLVPLWNKGVCLCSFIAKRPWIQKLLQPIGCSLAAMVFTAPICAKVFGTLTLLSPLANLLTGWPIAVMLPSAFLGGILYQLPLLRICAAPCLWVAGTLARCVMAVARWVASMSISVLQIRHMVWLLLLTLFPFALCWAVKLYGKRGAIRILAVNAVVAVSLGFAFAAYLHRNVSIRVADAGYSTVVVIETATVTAAVISGENEYAYRHARWYLSRCGVDALDVLVITDSSKKSYAALPELLKTIPAKTVVCPEKDAPTDVLSLKDGAVLTCGDMLSLATVDGWWRMDIGDTRILFTETNSLVADLPSSWKQTHLTVVRQSVPDDIHLLTAQEMVAVCAEKHVAVVKEQLVDVICPVAINREAAFFTTGQGDLIANDNFWL